MKCHGSSSSKGIKNSIIAAQKSLEQNLIKNIGNILSNHNINFDNNKPLSEQKTV